MGNGAINALILYKNNIKQKSRATKLMLNSIALILYKNNIKLMTLLTTQRSLLALILYKNNIKQTILNNIKEFTKEHSVNPL